MVLLCPVFKYGEVQICKGCNTFFNNTGHRVHLYCRINNYLEQGSFERNKNLQKLLQKETSHFVDHRLMWADIKQKKDFVVKISCNRRQSVLNYFLTISSAKDGDVQHGVHLSKIHLPERRHIGLHSVDAVVVVKVTAGVTVSSMRWIACVLRVEGTLIVSLFQCYVFYMNKQ